MKRTPRRSQGKSRKAGRRAVRPANWPNPAPIGGKWIDLPFGRGQVRVRKIGRRRALEYRARRRRK